MKNITIALILVLFASGISQAQSLTASLRCKIEFDVHSAPTDVVIETDASIGVYDAFSGGYLTYDGNGKSTGMVRRDFLKGGNCLVKEGRNFFFCNSANRSLDVLSEDFKRRTSFTLPANLKGNYDPTDALAEKGYIYSVDNDNHRIIKAEFAQSGPVRFVGGYGQAKLFFWYPYALAADSKGILYVSEVMNTRVQKITKELKFYEFIGSWGVKAGQLYRPTGIAVFKSETLLVADGYTGIIQILDMEGNFKGLLTDCAGKKLMLGSITHIRVNQGILAVVDAYNKIVYVYKLKEQ